MEVAAVYKTSEKRKHVRKPCNGKMYITRLSQTGGGEEIPLYLREISQGGMSGTCFRNDLDERGEVFLVKHNGTGIRQAKLVWSYKSIESVYMLGFSFQN
ncbi:hypothetical protein CHISP_2201 [Chitinispirillum alkaliphilum]|nr:hypothetical protein CHISP_2201 [Chitinispirillum alkaliphilum]